MEAIKVDNLKKKKLDGKRISLKQPHEVAYLRKIAQEEMSKLQKVIKDDAGNKGIYYQIGPKLTDVRISNTKLIRICKALLKATK